jgi:CubicO group peptidase (beta-lactamase class C family)
MIKFISFFFLFGIIQGAKGQNGTRAFMNDSLDGYVEKALTDWKIPGVAISVVKDGKVVMMKSYGVADGAPE